VGGASVTRWVLPLTALVVLGACRSVPVPPKTAEVPVSLPSALEQARTELDAGRWGRAWSLVANKDGDSVEKKNFLDKVLTEVEKQRGQAEQKGDTFRTRDLDATLQLIHSGSWTPPPLPPAEPKDAPASEWLKGTATVVVNRGLKVENGAAQADIVIGSGFFITGDGYLLTNHHVIESEVEPGTSASSKLSIRLPGSKGERLPAKVVGWDRNLDLALLKTEYKPDYIFVLGTGPDPAPGQRLQALGSPGGLEATLTEGIVSAVKRPLLAVGEVLQIDVAVNPGNSGGPLVDNKGRVVGIVFAGIRDFQGVNFAIPVSLVQKVLPRLRAGGKATLPWLGLGMEEDHRGLEVAYVAPRSPADWAGVRVGDRLTSVAGTPVNELGDAQVRLLDFGTDAVIPIEVVRDGVTVKLWSTLETRPDYPLKDAAMTDLTSRVLPLAFGVSVEDVGHNVDRSFRVTNIWPGSAAEELQLTVNDSLEVLDWVVDTKDQALITRWKVKRRLGGWLESVVQLGAPFEDRFFL
jgi:S1-C subfamily serine protease